jgi:hypothetical protein
VISRSSPTVVPVFETAPIRFDLPQSTKVHTSALGTNNSQTDLDIDG